jgi:hypothetical protein
MAASALEIQIKGKEKASYWFDTDNGRRKAKFHHKILDFKGTAFQFHETLGPGDYTIPFDFMLPDHIPASIYFKAHHSHDKPKSVVKYTIKGILHGNDGRDLAYKQLLILHEPPVAFQENNSQMQTVAISNCCCINKGSTNMSVSFPKNIFFNHEIAAANISINNNGCDLAVHEVEF